MEENEEIGKNKRPNHFLEIKNNYIKFSAEEMKSTHKRAPAI